MKPGAFSKVGEKPGSLWSRARNRRRVGPASDRARDSAASGWVVRRKAESCARSTQYPPVVVVVVAAGPADSAVAGRRLARGGTLRRVARMAGQGRADEAFEAAFGGVGGHCEDYRAVNGFMTRRPS